MSLYVSADQQRPASTSLATRAAIALAGMAVLAAGAGFYLRGVATGPAPTGLRALEIGPRALVIGENHLVGDGRAGDGTNRIDLAFLWPGLGPPVRVHAGPDGRSAAAPLSATVLISLAPADDTTDPGLRPSLLHGRFLEATVWSYSGDLIARRFRAGSPYAGEELVFLPPDGRTFAARCPVDPSGAEPRCTALWRRRGIDISVNFDRALLMEAQNLREQVLTWFERSVR